MIKQTPLHCPKCGKILDKKELSDGELVEKYCDKCKIKIVFKAEIEIKVFIEYKKDEELS